jgi:hypothetical protein
MPIQFSSQADSRDSSEHVGHPMCGDTSHGGAKPISLARNPAMLIERPANDCGFGRTLAEAKPLAGDRQVAAAVFRFVVPVQSGSVRFSHITVTHSWD